MEYFAGATLGFVCAALVWWIGFTVVRTDYAPGGQGFYSGWRALLRSALILISVTFIVLGASFTYAGGGVSWKVYLAWLAVYGLGVAAYFFYRYGMARR